LTSFILAIDIGTTSTKGLAVTSDGTVLASFNKPYPTFYPNPGYAEQNPETIFNEVIEVIQTTLAKTGNSRTLSGLSFSCAMHSLMAVDKTGNPITPLIIWADMRSTIQADALKVRSESQAIYEQSGTPIHPMSPLSKILWMKEEQPQLFSTVHKFISIKEYIFFRFFGEYKVDYSLASATGLFDNNNLKWSQLALDAIGIDSDKLSQPVSPYHQFTNLKSEIAGELGITSGTPFIIGASDGCLANLGSGAMEEGELSITIGTSGAVRMASKGHKKDEKQRIFNYRLDEHHFIVGGATNNGAVLLSWFTENFEKAKSDAKVFDAEAFSVADTEGLIFLPYVLGERAPIYDPHAKGVFFGVGIQHKLAHFKRAILEGICFEIRSIVKAVEETVCPAKHVIASGGFTKSDLWVQLMADVLGKTVEVDSKSDASALGAAMMGFKSLGIVYTPPANNKAKIFSPEEKNNQRYSKKFILFESLYKNLKSDFLHLKDL
jgi:gluconokinase